MRLLFVSCLAAASCVIVPAQPCADGIIDGTETDVDCGGATCATCGDNARCSVDADCDSTFCAGGVCVSLPSTTGAQTYPIDPGAGTVIVPGVQAGYGITANTGGNYRIVWTGDSTTSGQYREFTGTVFITSGSFSSFTPGCANNACPLESNDTVGTPVAVAGGTRIDFDTITTDGIDGFDFTVTAEPVFFDLLIDGTRTPSLVFFTSGGQMSSAATDPFGLTTQ